MDDTTPPLGAPAAGGASADSGGQTPPPGDPRPPSSGALTDIRRTEDGRVVAGVCAGIGRYLGIDPIIPRIVFAVLTIVGFGGLLAYAAAWILLPDERTGESYLKRWLGLGDNEPQIRLVGLGAAALVALTWTWGWGWPLGPIWIAAVVVVAWVAFREYQERNRRHSTPRPPVPPYGPGPQQQPAPPYGAAPPYGQAPPPYAAASPYPQAPTAHGTPTRSYAPVPPAPPRPPAPPHRPPPPAPKPPKRPNPRHDGGLLTILTLSLTLVATGVTIIATQGDLHASVYVAVALATLAAGMLVGTVLGNARPLIFPALVTVVVLVVAVAVPRWDAGRIEATPTSAAAVRDAYGIGFGEVIVDLTGVTDPAALDGKNIEIEVGVGNVRVYVPPTLDIGIDSSVGIGAISALGAERGGLSTQLTMHDNTERPDLDLEIDVRIGMVEVIRS